MSRKTAQSGFSDHIRVMLPTQKVISASECPRSLNIVAATQEIMTYGIPSAKYPDGTQDQGLRVLSLIHI